MFFSYFKSYLELKNLSEITTSLLILNVKFPQSTQLMWLTRVIFLKEAKKIKHVVRVIKEILCSKKIIVTINHILFLFYHLVVSP